MTSQLRVEFDGRWTEPEFLEAALDDIVEMLATAASNVASTQLESYTWSFRQPRTGRYVTLEITARRTS